MTQKGYEKDFIGDNIEVNMPGFSTGLEGAVYRGPNLEDEIYRNFIHYTLVMNKTTKQLIFSASNINQNEHIQIDRDLSKDWDLDPDIANNQQLDNRFYKSNDWDRGHMVQRSNNCWGEDFRAAKLANDDTFFYTNAAFQHKFFNQDEWLKLEDYIGDLKEDSNGKLCVFTGPIHLEFDRQYSRNWHDSVRIPSGFFKIVCYKSKQTNQLATKAFILYQDNEFISNKKSGASQIKLKNYQVTITEIEQLTGLIFDKAIADSNPLYFSEPDSLPDNITINNYPERIPFDNPNDVVSDINSPRCTQDATDEDKAIIINAAMINPAGSQERANEWVSLMNISGRRVDLNGWTLTNQKDQKIELAIDLEEGYSHRIFMKEHNSFRLSNSGGTIILKNDAGDVIDRESYTRKDVEIENRALRF